jgi:hypothetical protein
MRRKAAGCMTSVDHLAQTANGGLGTKQPTEASPFLEPTPGFEPGTPSLRVKCSTN